ncbi:MAG: type II toxin-antitoxin system VapC family toxin [Sphingomonadales bacterium]|nr:type II toxin-antitoxin system VapC family toxin [Sphingomonadales bacterium]
MADFVIDCSPVLAWFFDDEISDYSEAVLRHLESRAPAIAPRLWQLELTNGLVVGERRRRSGLTAPESFLRFIQALNVSFDDSIPEVAVLLDVAREHRLSVYDSVYLTLAIRESLPIATLDKQLAQAAEASGVGLWSPSS